MNILCVASPAENVEAFSVTDQFMHQVTASTEYYFYIENSFLCSVL